MQSRSARVSSIEGVSLLLGFVAWVADVLNWQTRAVIVLIALAFMGHLVWRTNFHWAWRSVAAFIGAFAIIAVTWKPIWIGFRANYPKLQIQTPFYTAQPDLKSSFDAIPLPTPSPTIVLASPPLSSGTAVDLGAGQLKGNEFHVRSSGYATVIKSNSNSALENNSFDVKARRDPGPVPEDTPPPIERRKPKQYTNSQLQANVYRLSGVLHQMQAKIIASSPGQRMSDETLRQTREYLAKYDNEVRDIEYTLLYRSHSSTYGPDRPTLLTDRLAAGISPFDDLAKYLQSLL